MSQQPTAKKGNASAHAVPAAVPFATKADRGWTVSSLRSHNQFQMAAAWWFIACCCKGGSCVLTVASLVFYAMADQTTLSDADQRMWAMLCTSGMVLPGEALLLYLELRHRVEQQQQQIEPPPGKFLAALIVVECLLAFIALGMAVWALVVDLAATPARDAYQLSADVMACGSGALIATTAVGLLLV